MKRILALASFALALTFVLGTDDGTNIIVVPIRSEMALRTRKIEEKVKECRVKTNEGKTYDFPPSTKSGLTRPDTYYCEYVSEAQASFGGLWTITIVPENGASFEETFSVRVTENVWVKPSNTITVYAGEWVTVWIDGNETDIRSCNLTNPDGKVHDLMHENIEGIIRQHGCRVRMRVDDIDWYNKKMYGKEEWKLSQEVGDNFVQFGVLNMYVRKDQGHAKEVENYTWKLGEKQKMKIEKKGEVIIFCQFTRPDGTLMQMTYGKCELEIEAVTLLHVGTWRVSYAIAGQMNVKQIEFNVKPWDLDSLGAKLIPGTGQEIHLLCRFGVSELKFCSFIRPDQKIIHASIGLGNENYSYYGDGYDKHSPADRYYGDCGLTIHKPSEIDYGLWTCKTSIDNMVRAAVIDVAKSQAKQPYKISNPETFVKRGDRLKIQCTINAPLDYCWLTSPNGTSYSVLANVSSDSTLKYDGRGLTMGDCGAFVENANTTDSGKWTCHLGITGSAEVEAKVLVQVTDSYLIPVKTEVYANENPTLTCRTFLGEEGTLRYCRWVRPNGHGITEGDESRYKTTARMDTCELSILTVEPEDIGQWTCVAALARAGKDEEWATVDVKSVQDGTTVASVVSIVLGSALLVMTLIGASFAILHIYRRRNSQANVKSPPPYNPEDYEIPRIVQGDSDQPTMDKDYRY